MKRQMAFKFELVPNGEQQRMMRRFAGACRWVYNEMRKLQIALYEHGLKRLTYPEQCQILTGWRNSKNQGWLKESPVHPLQQSCKNLERSYQNFFAKRAGFPHKHKKFKNDSFRYPDSKQIKFEPENRRIFLPKLGWMRLRLSQEVLGTIRNVTVSLGGGKFFVSIQTEREIDPPVLVAKMSIGIDMGIAWFATFSDGTFIAPLNSFKKHEARLARYQRAMSRKVKFSKNWKKTNAKVQKVHSRIANIRKDYLHKASTTISKNHAMICVEDLQVKNMSRSACGTQEQPGRNVRAKSGLNKAILDQGWGEFRRQLQYKAEWNGAIFVAVPPQHTSQTCPVCGHVAAENRPTQSKFLCVECGHQGHADVVGAINILARGHRVLACGETAQSGVSAKQEPTEAIWMGKPCSDAVGIPCL
jgi:putative transposase